MNTPLVSVIIPTHKKGFLLNETLSSVLNQSFQDFEIIVVINKSDDKAQEIVENYNDKRISYYFQETTGLNSARNLGLKNSKGDYIALLNSGDIWKPDKLKTHVSILDKKSKIGLVYCSSRVLDEQGNPIIKKTLSVRSGRLFKKLVMKNFLYNGSVALFRRSCLEKTGLFDESIRKMTNWDFFLRMSVYYKFYGVDECLVEQRIKNKTLSSEFESFENSGFKILNRIFQITDLKVNDIKLINTAYAMRYKYVGEKFFENRFYEKSRGYFLEALKRDPLIVIKSDTLILYLLSHFSDKNIAFFKKFKKGL